MPVSEPSVINNHRELLFSEVEIQTRKETPCGDFRGAGLTLAVMTLAASASYICNLSGVAPGRVRKENVVCVFLPIISLISVKRTVWSQGSLAVTA